MQQLRQYCYEGWPDRHLLASPIYLDCTKSCCSECPTNAFKSFDIFSSMRLEVLDKFMKGTKASQSAESVQKRQFGGQVSAEKIQDMVLNCLICLKHKVNGPEPLCTTPCPQFPWQKLGAYIFQCPLGLSIPFDFTIRLFGLIFIE